MEIPISVHVKYDLSTQNGAILDRKRDIMTEEVRIRERKSAKYGVTYEYRFEIAALKSVFCCS